jgi:hypothetical protein
MGGMIFVSVLLLIFGGGLAFMGFKDHNKSYRQLGLGVLGVGVLLLFATVIAGDPESRAQKRLERIPVSPVPTQAPPFKKNLPDQSYPQL